MTRPTLAMLVADGSVDAELAALLWLLGEGGVPVVVAGSASREERAFVAEAVLSVDPARPWVALDAEAEMPDTSRLSALLRSGIRFGIMLAAPDLRAVLARLAAPPDGLPEDAVRRLGLVLVVASTGKGLRLAAVHYLRPTERDAQGHLQRRPPAVLATWDQRADRFEHFAWGIMPELADRVDRSQADLEGRQRDRAAFLAELAREASVSAADGVLEWTSRMAAYLAAEPPRVPAPPREPARPSPFHGGLADPHLH